MFSILIFTLNFHLFSQSSPYSMDARYRSRSQALRVNPDMDGVTISVEKVGRYIEFTVFNYSKYPVFVGREQLVQEGYDSIAAFFEVFEDGEWWGLHSGAMYNLILIPLRKIDSSEYAVFTINLQNQFPMRRGLYRIRKIAMPARVSVDLYLNYDGSYCLIESYDADFQAQRHDIVIEFYFPGSRRLNF